MKNILILTSSLCIGGAERVIANIAKHLDRTRFNLTICHLKERGEIGDELIENGNRVIGIPQARSGLGKYFSFLRLRRVLLENNIDLVHSHTTYSLVDGALAHLSLARTKMVHTFHYGNYPNYVKRYMFLERFFGRIPNRLVAVGIEQCGMILNTYGFPSEHIVTIHNGVDPMNTEDSADSNWRDRLALVSRPVIGTICTLIEQKGLTYFLDMAKQVALDSTAFFVIVGDGPLREELENKCRQLGLEDRVLFTGWIKDAASTMMPLFDVFVQSSLWEAMSMAVLEAMAAGRPVVVTDVGDNRHVVGHGVNGFVVPPKDNEAMAHAVKELVMSRELRDQFGQAGCRRFEQNFAARAMTKRYEDLYSEILNT